MIKYYLCPVDKAVSSEKRPANLAKILGLLKLGNIQGSCDKDSENYILRVDTSNSSEFTEIEKLPDIMTLENTKWDTKAIKELLGITLSSSATNAEIEQQIAKKCIGVEITISKVFNDGR